MRGWVKRARGGGAGSGDWGGSGRRTAEIGRRRRRVWEGHGPIGAAGSQFTH
jgi:hypothetical protein